MGAVSNVREDGTLRVEAEGDDVVKILKGNEGWHADSTFKPIQAKGAVFSAEVVPTVGGHTGWADMRAAYDALDEATQARIATLAAYHSLHYSQGAHRPRAEEGHRRLPPAGLRGRRGRAAAAGQGPSRHRPQVAADRPPCARHSGPGAGGVRSSCCRS